MKKLILEIPFDNAKEALAYYTEIFGDIHALRVPVTEEQAIQFNLSQTLDLNETTMHARFEVFGQTIYTADTFGNGKTPENLTIALCATSDDSESETDLTELFKHAQASGKVKVEMPFEPQEWTKKYGILVDQYGIRWQFYINDEF